MKKPGRPKAHKTGEQDVLVFETKSLSDPASCCAPKQEEPCNVGWINALVARISACIFPHIEGRDCPVHLSAHFAPKHADAADALSIVLRFDLGTPDASFVVDTEELLSAFDEVTDFTVLASGVVQEIRVAGTVDGRTVALAIFAVFEAEKNLSKPQVDLAAKFEEERARIWNAAEGIVRLREIEDAFKAEIRRSKGESA